MTTSKRLLFAVVILLSVSACRTAGATPALPSLAVSPAESVGAVATFALEPTPEAVSASDPEVRRVLESCEVFESYVGIDKVAGVGYLEHASDAPHYVPVDPNNVEIQTDDPAWVVAFRGEIPRFKYRGETWVDPICIVVGGQATFLGVGARLLADGGMITPAPLALVPDRQLLPLAP